MGICSLQIDSSVDWRHGGPLTGTGLRRRAEEVESLRPFAGPGYHDPRGSAASFASIATKCVLSPFLVAWHAARYRANLGPNAAR
jgi:hypothetical protein